jgi:hypothetical protein
MAAATIKHNASRGRHAPGNLRDLFSDLVEEYGLEYDEELASIDGEEISTHWLYGQLWNCTDIMPRGLCDALEMPDGSTYAKGVRWMKHGDY